MTTTRELRLAALRHKLSGLLKKLKTSKSAKLRSQALALQHEIEDLENSWTSPNRELESAYQTLECVGASVAHLQVALIRLGRLKPRDVEVLKKERQELIDNIKTYGPSSVGKQAVSEISQAIEEYERFLKIKAAFEKLTKPGK